MSAIAPTALRVLLLILSLLGWALFARAMIINGIASAVFVGDGMGGLVAEGMNGLGLDTYAYWLAGSNIMAGEPVYWTTSIHEVGAYLYPPPFAQAWVPLSIVPEVAVDWVWRLLGVLCIRYMAGSWQVAGLWWLFPGSITAITVGNVTFQVAALTVAALRGRAEGVFPATIVKFSALAVAPFIWVRRPAARRGLVVGGVAAGGMVAVSAALQPGLWADYFGILDDLGGASMDSPGIISALPTPAADYALRLGIAAVVVVASVRWNSPHLAFVATVVATPTIWVQHLAVLFALLTLENDDRLKPFLLSRRRGDRRLPRLLVPSQA